MIEVFVSQILSCLRFPRKPLPKAPPQMLVSEGDFTKHTSCVAAGNENRYTLKGKLEKLIALPLLVISRQVIFINAI